MIKKNSDDGKLSILDYVFFVFVIFVVIYFFRGSLGLHSSSDVIQSFFDAVSGSPNYVNPLNSNGK